MDKLGNYPKGFLCFLDDRGISNKAGRVRNTFDLVDFVNKYTKDILSELRVSLICDPAVILTKSKIEYFFRENGVGKMVSSWEVVNFPFTDIVFMRGGSFDPDNKFSLPMETLEYLEDKNEFLKKFREILENYAADQIIIHPRVSNQNAKKNLIGVRSQSIGREVYIEFGFGGIAQIRDMKDADYFIDGNISLLLSKIDKKYLDLVKAIEIITKSLDKYLIENINLSKNSVYEFKCFGEENSYIVDFMDYELV